MSNHRENTDSCDEHGHQLLAEAHDEPQVDEEAGVLACLGQVGEQHGEAEQQDRVILEHPPQRRERVHLRERNGGLLALVLITSKDESSHPLK